MNLGSVDFCRQSVRQRCRYVETGTERFRGEIHGLRAQECERDECDLSAERQTIQLHDTEIVSRTNHAVQESLGEEES